MKNYDLPFEILEQIGEIKNISIPRQGHTSFVAILETSDQKYIVKKTEHELFNQWLVDEYKALQLLSRTGLPVPDVYFFHAADTSRWLLMDYIDGVNLREFLSREPDRKDKERAIAAFGLCLRNIHDRPCPSELIRYDQPWLEVMLNKAEYNLTHYQVDGSLELLTRLKETKPIPIENTLIHGDFTIDNVLIKNGNIVGIIDWSGAAFGDPRYDVALAIRPKANAFVNKIDRAIFFESYGRFEITKEQYNYFEEGLYAFF